jgi:CheY-like chemotaxis protein
MPDGREALREITVIRKPSIIISDIMMHDMNGYELYDRLLRLDEFADIPFVFLTAKNSKKDRLKWLGQGDDTS